MIPLLEISCFQPSELVIVIAIAIAIMSRGRTEVKNAQGSVPGLSRLTEEAPCLSWFPSHDLTKKLSRLAALPCHYNTCPDR